MKVFSHSRLTTFEQCPLKFKYRYIDKIIPEIDKSIEAHLGSCAHDSLEWLYLEVKKGRIPNIEEVINFYSENWEKNYNGGVKIVRKNMTPKDYFNKGVGFLVNYYMKHTPFEDGTIECEKKIMIDLDKENGWKLQGFIDRFVFNEQTGEYEIHDYKTANNLPTREKVHQDRQLALYSIAIKELFGEDKEVALVWHYLAHNTKIQIKKTNDDLKRLKQDVVNLIKVIKSTEHFPAKKSVLCGWCEYKSMCPMFGCKPNERQKKIETVIPKTNKEKLDIF